MINDKVTSPAQRIDFLDQKVVATLERMEREAVSDRRLMSSVSASLARLGQAPTSEELLSMTAVAEDAFLPVSREVGCLLFQLAIGTGATTIVEYGTSFGMSTLYLASAARRVGGRVVGTELSGRKAAVAEANLVEAGVDGYAEVRVGDALQTLASVNGPVGLVLLDGWPPLHLPVFRLLEPKLAMGSVVVSDNVSTGADKVGEFHRYLTDRSDLYVRTSLPIDDGIDLIVRLR